MKIKRELTDEQREAYKLRLAKARAARRIKKNDERVKVISVSLRIEEIEALKSFGKGKLTRGIRFLLKDFSASPHEDDLF